MTTDPKDVCKFPGGCDNPPTKGAYVIPKAPGEKRFPFTILCKEHGEMAIARGARKITYRPKAAKSDELPQETDSQGTTGTTGTTGTSE